MTSINEMDVHELKALLDAGENVRLVDVRTAAEFNKGIIEGGEYLLLDEIPARMDELTNKEGEKLVIYCRSGNRSGQACLYLQQNSAIEATNLLGGIISWHKEGNAVVPPPVAV